MDRFLLTLTAFVVGLPAASQPAAEESATARLTERPLAFPSLAPGDSCPVTTGHHDVPSQPQIFGAPLWLGRGPVYMGHLWGGWETGKAVYQLPVEPRRSEPGVLWLAKTSWVSRPDYVGPIIVRGRALRPTTGDFGVRGDGDRDLTLELDSNPAIPDRWNFWPTSLVVPALGCYGLQIDTLAGTDIVVIEIVTATE